MKADKTNQKTLETDEVDRTPNSVEVDRGLKPRKMITMTMKSAEKAREAFIEKKLSARFNKL